MSKNTVKKLTNTVQSTEGLPIRYDLYFLESIPSPTPVILFLHGFKGFKDWGTFPEVCRQIAAKGFAVVAMNFSLNGIGENKMELDRLDLFARETFSQDLDDVGNVIEAINKQEITADSIKLDAQNIGILGHSRGGHVAVAAAAEFEMECLVTWSAVDDYNARWSEQMINDWKTRGVTEVKNGRTGQIMPLKKIVYDDALENADRIIALNRVGELEIPALFIHGEEDEAVDSVNSKHLYESCSSDEREFMLIPDAGHTYGGSHPFRSDELPKPLQEALTKTIKWFKIHLK